VQLNVGQLSDSFFGNLIGIEKADIFFVPTRNGSFAKHYKKVIVMNVLFLHHPSPGFELSSWYEWVWLFSLAEVPV
jgi:hypothetical protein